MPTYHEAKIEVEKLVNHFATLSLKNKKTYNEAATRQELILPLFRALGWDTQNSREVSPEEKISRGYVDFAFRLEGIPRFFLETKRVSENLNDPRWAHQAINYSWLKGVTWAVLSDFEDTKILNAEWQETIPQRAEFKGFHWQQYLDRFDDLMLLSKEAIRDGAIDRLAESVGKKIKRTPVNRQLFEDLATWRHELFRHLRPYNPLWSVAQIDEAVQRILNRLIFIRTVEDRHIEEERLMPLLRQWEDEGHKWDLVKRLSALFRELDSVYNAQMFAPHFSESAESEPEPYTQVIKGLHDVQGGYGFYDFSAIDADVLGTIYEQYLSYVAQDPEATEVISKRGKRKSQGIYYTPQFVVKYIVQNTLGKLLEEGGLERALNIKVLDPACGSGSFLLEAFNVLDTFIAHESGQIPGEDPQADAIRRKRILTNNLYGVDLDAQAVDITKLNLWLRAVGRRERLATLDNIRQGNSLIDDPAIAGRLAFNWEHQYPEVMEQGGFDAVIGNPPYVRMEEFKDTKSYLRERYKAVHAERLDLYGYFIQREFELLRQGGYFGMIVSNKFLRAEYGRALRDYMTSSSQLEQLVDLAGLPVFPEATVRTIIISARRRDQGISNPVVYIPVMPLEEYSLVEKRSIPLTSIVSRTGYTVLPNQLQGGDWNFARVQEGTLLQKLISTGIALTDYLKPLPICRGVVSGLTEAFVVSAGVRKSILAQNPEADEIIKPVLNGRNIRRYYIEGDDKYLIYTYHGVDISRYPAVEAHLNPYRKSLEKRATRQEWYELQQPQFRFAQHMDAPKIIFPDISTTARFALDLVGYYGTNTTYFLPLTDLYLLGILNSSVANFYFVQVCAGLEGAGETYLRFFGQYLENIPIAQADIARHDSMTGIVEQMLSLQNEFAAAEAMKEDRRNDLAREIKRLDAEIDQVVYALYGLTEDEIALVEGNS